MRILYVPFFSMMNLGGCSIFNNLKVILKRLVETYPDVFVYYPLPGEPFDASAATYLNHPRIKTFFVKAYVDQNRELVYCPDQIIDMFNVNTGQFIPDLVLCDKTRMSVWLSSLLNNNLRAVSSSIPMINFVQYPAAKEGRTKHYSEAFEFAQVMGMYDADANIFGSKNDYDMVMRAARKYATGRVIKKVMKTAWFDVTTVIDCDRLDKYQQDKPTDEIHVNYASRFGTHYEFEELFAEVELLYQVGRELKLVITSPSADPGMAGSRVLKKLRARKMNFEVTSKCSQEMFYTKAAKCHVSLILIKEAGAMLTVREQMYLGQAIVMPREKLYVEMFPDYPFMYKNQKEMRALLRHVVDDYWTKAVQDVVRKYRKVVHEMHDIAPRIGSLYDLFSRTIEARKDLSNGVLFLTKEVLEAAGNPDRMTYAQFRALIRKVSRTKRDIEKTYSGYGRRHFFWALQELGYRDTCDAEHPLFVRGS